MVDNMAQRYNLHLLPVLLVATFLLVGCVIASCPYGHDHSHDNELGNPHGHSDWGDEADTVEDFFQPDPDLHEAHDHAHGHAHHDHDDHSTGHNAHAHSHAHAHAHAHHDPHVHHEHHAHFGHAHGGHGHKHGHGQGQGRGQGQGEEEEESSRRRMRSAEELAEERELHDSLHDPFDDLDPHAGLFDAGNGRMPSRVVVDALAAFGKGAASGKETSAAAAGEGVAEEEDKEDEKGEKKLEAGTAAAAVPPQAKGGGTSSSIAREDAPSASLLVLGYLNLFSDGVHNFTDGMALGAAFLNHGTAAGWSRMLFMLAHEIPQEVGDFGILVRSGLSVFKALALNFLSALMAVAGTAVGFTAGGFIYISVAGVMPDMHNQGTTLGVTLLQLGSMAAGMGIAMVISVME
eukprot:jgi/Mesen1/8244/ME000443S07390